MWRRKFIAGLAGAVAFPLAIRAQTPNRIYRLGHLAHSSNSEASSRQIILPELARLGFVEGRNLVFDARVGEPDALPGLMRELLAARPDAIVAIGPPATALAGAATSTVPIVVMSSELVERGFAASHAQPRGNVTGVMILARELDAKRLSLLLEAVPDRRRVAALILQTGIGVVDVALRKSAAELGVELLHAGRLPGRVRSDAGARRAGIGNRRGTAITSGWQAAGRPCTRSPATNGVRMGEYGARGVSDRIWRQLHSGAQAHGRPNCSDISRRRAR